jgi:hypothetical protein
LSDEDLANRSAKRYVASAKSGFPDRIEMRDAEPGERLILVNYVHQPADTPYRASHAVFVLEGAEKSYDAVNEVPEVLLRRLIEGDVCDGRQLDATIHKFLAKPEVAYLHAHYAKPGCYAARIERA